MSRFFGKSNKVAPEPEPEPPIKYEVDLYTSEDPIWNEFAVEELPDEENEHGVDYMNPGPLAIQLAEHCSREGAIGLDSEKIMYFSEVTNYLLILKHEGRSIGFLLLSSFSREPDAKIWLVCVNKSEKKKNLSKILIDQAKRIAKEEGKTTIHLEALTREIGEKVYEPQGFVFNSSRTNDMTAQLGGGKRNSKTRKRKSRRRLAGNKKI